MRYSGIIKLHVHVDAEDFEYAYRALHIRAAELAEKELSEIPDIYEVEPDSVYIVDS